MSQSREIADLKARVNYAESYAAYAISKRVHWLNSLSPQEREKYCFISFEQLWSAYVDLRNELETSQYEVYYLKEHIRPTRPA
jgi:hypothetical protein